MPTRRNSEYKVQARAYLQQNQGEKAADVIGGLFGKYTPRTHAPRLRYLKFKSNNISKTVEFYQILGMNIDYRVTLPFSDNNNVCGTKSLVAFSYPAPQPKHLADVPTPSKQPLALIFQEEKPQFQLVFENIEETQKRKVAEFIQDYDKGGKEEAEARKLADSLMTEVIHNYEYLVIYVHMLSRLHKTLVSKGFQSEISPIELSETKMCIIKDPNGLEVRLLELNDAQSAARKSWVFRIAYYTIPTLNSTESSERYEKLFTSGGTKAGKRRKSITEEVKVHSKEANDLQSFRIVDSDDFALGLSKTTFIWMGNELRSEDFTMCFVQKKELGKSSATIKTNTSVLVNGLLSAVGFQVASQDNFLLKPKSEKNHFLIDSAPISRVPGVGVFQKLFDGINKINIELYVPGSGREVATETVVQVRKKEKIDFKKQLTALEVEKMVLDPPKFQEAKLRFPSESAIEKPAKWSNSDESSEDEPKPASLIDVFSVSAGPELSSSNLDFSKKIGLQELKSVAELANTGTVIEHTRRSRRRFKDKAKSAHF